MTQTLYAHMNKKSINQSINLARLQIPCAVRMEGDVPLRVKLGSPGSGFVKRVWTA
jgi:hypothetical protein